MLAGDSTELRKLRGAFFTPYAIAEFLASWALRGPDSARTVLDPTCGEGVFLLAAAEQVARESGYEGSELFGLDIHPDSLNETRRLLEAAGRPPASLFEGDFFDEPTPDQLGARLPLVDAVVGNPPFVRYQEHRGEVRAAAAAAALRQGVRLSGLASSWAALLVHASGFLKPEGRLAMVVPAELLSVGYAEPIRQWLRRRFNAVHLVLFDRLQFADAEEQVVLLVARGSGGCNAFTLHEVDDADALAKLHIFDSEAYAPSEAGKWTDLLIPEGVRGILRRSTAEHFQPLSTYGNVELGTVTGNNKYFTLSEATRREFSLKTDVHVQRTVPPGTRNIPGLRFTQGQWEQLRLRGERVWLLNPNVERPSGGLSRYLNQGVELGVPDGYKCSIRTPWWRPPVQRAPDMFFTYMSHVMPRLIANDAGVTFTNSMHGLRITADVSPDVRAALPFLLVNTMTMLSAEITGRAYGGGILKMEPREAMQLALPRPRDVEVAWAQHLKSRQGLLDELVRARDWTRLTAEVDQALLTNTLQMSDEEVAKLRTALIRRRARRQRKEDGGGGSG